MNTRCTIGGKVCDGGPSMELLDTPKSVKSRAKVKEEVQALVEAAADTPGYTPMRKPGLSFRLPMIPEEFLPIRTMVR